MPSSATGAGRGLSCAIVLGRRWAWLLTGAALGRMCAIAMDHNPGAAAGSPLSCPGMVCGQRTRFTLCSPHCPHRAQTLPGGKECGADGGKGKDD